ncbi:TlpA family protein disulfide reductase [Pinibacter aurantiacus]|uniref:TlpA family protein disulfide reductase n=1 Tax=Pinibacter aurantiacus TaxID=2851599 RepID=A0A9E2W8X9_9BACT|nr:TlpA disulfide reductase family protein [Pinibacter aurantiacus]MBV4359191.1 TlpA family protein disulfide reductase [Pinibacter aurantiacus]
MGFKKLMFVVLLSCSALFAAAQKGYTTVNGTIHLKKMDSSIVELYKVKMGTLEKVDSIKMLVNGDSTFTFSFKPGYKGYYMIGIALPKARFIYSDIAKYCFYAKGSDVVNMDITDLTSYTMAAGNTKENQILSEWNKMLLATKLNPLKNGADFKAAYAVVDSLDGLSKEWIKKQHSGNAAFDALLKRTVPNDVALYATRYVNSPRPANSKWEQKSEDFGAYILHTDFKELMRDGFILNLPFGQQELNGLTGVMGRLDRLKGDTVKTENEYYERVFRYIPNDTLKGVYMASGISYIRSYEKLKDFETKYGKYLTTPEQKQMLADQFKKVSEFKKGTPGYNFTYKDAKGNKVSFSDLKGKVVLIDVWATWCGPCKAELPYLRKLEDEFHGNDNIVFVGLSSDEDVNLEKWKTFVAENDLKGIQLKADGGFRSGFTTVYKINAIPRFMVFDKQGKVVTIDAPRPSEPALKELLLQTLNN